MDQRGLCQYEHHADWFAPNARQRRQAARICTNCPIIAACAADALRLGATDGVWASVALPGIGEPAELKAARARLHDVITHYSTPPPGWRTRAHNIRAAVHHAATRDKDNTNAA